MVKSIRSALFCLCISMSLLGFMLQPACAQVKEIILDNPSFEDGVSGTPAYWFSCNEKGTTEFRFILEDNGATAHTGKGCLMIQGKSDDTIASWIYKGVLYTDGRNSGYTIKGGTTYEWAAWVKTEGLTSSPILLIWEFDNKTPIASHQSERISGDSGWKRVVCRFTTKATCTGLQLRLNLFGKGTVWFDDVSLAEITTGESGRSVNLLKNSSFEITTVPGRADDWGMSGSGTGLGGVVGAHYTQRHFDWFKVDSATAYDGRNSFLIHRPFDNSDADASDYIAQDFILGSSWHLNGEIEAGNPYTLSCYLKSDTPGFKIKMVINGDFGSHLREVNASTSWERYVLTTPTLSSSGGKNMFIHLIPEQKGTVWIDALQLEKGETATPYAPSQKDMVAMGKEEWPPVSTAACAMVTSAPGIDGVLNDACYSVIPKLNLVNLKGDNVKEPTEGYIFRDRDNLYIAMKCYQSRMEEIKTSIKDNDGSVWVDDSVEIFIDPELSRETYYRLAVNAAGVKFDGKMLDNVWNGSWEVKTYKGVDFWSLEMKIPFNTFEITPMVGSTWGINLCRNNQSICEYSCWSPVYTGFHNPKRFGEITGIPPESLNPYRYGLKGISLEPRTDGRGYDVGVDVTNYTGAGKRITVETVVKTGTDNSSASTTLLLKDGQQQKVKIGPFSIAGKAADDITVNLLESASNKRLASVSSIKVPAPQPIEAVTELNYYTDEKTASVYIISNIGAEAAKKMILVVEIKDSQSGKLLLARSIRISGALTPVNFSIAGFNPGEYLVLARLLDAKGATICEATDKLIKREKIAGEVKINRMNRMLVINGRPIIAVGQWMIIHLNGSQESKEKSRAFYDKVLAHYSRHFNFIAASYFGSCDDLGSVLDLAQKNNMKMFVGDIYGFDYSKEKIGELASKIKGHPAFLFWPAIYDEVVANEEKSKYANDRCAWIKEVDPYHPVFILNHCVSFSSWEKFGYPGEIVEYHDYVFSSGRQGVPFWASVVKNAGRVAKESRKPLVTMPQTFSSMQWWSRGPSADEIEAAVYTALANGSTIVKFYIFDQEERNLWERVRRITNEIKELTPILASFEPVPEITVNSSKIHTLVKKHNGGYYLITANSSEDTMAVKLDLSSLKLPAGSVAQVMFEDREVTLENNVLADTFAGYQRHVYRIDFN
jgi:hypothetical protein